MSVLVGASEVDELDRFLRAQAEERDTPIRITDGRGRTISPETASEWSEAEASLASLSQEQCNEHGITVVRWGTTRSPVNYERITFPRELWPDRRARRRIAGDVIRFDEGAADESDPIRVPVEQHEDQMAGEFIAGEQTSRMILLRFQPAWVSNVAMMGWDWLIPALDNCTNEEWLAEAAVRREQHARDQFMAAMVQRNTSDEIARIRSEIVQAETRFGSAQSQVARERTMLSDLSQSLDAVLSLDADPDALREACERDWEAINRHEHVSRVAWRGTALVVYTDELTITRPDREENNTAPLGEFAMFLDKRGGTVTVHNLTMRRASYDHPHVQSGRICAGDLQSTLDQLLGRNEFASAVNMIIAMLGRCTPEDVWGRHVEWWFGADDSPQPETQAV